MKQVRQGDVLLIPVADLAIPTQPKPNVCKAKANKRLVLAEGESSLHEHTLDADDAELVQQGERMLLSIFKPTPMVVTHTNTGEVLSRHTPIELPCGLYEVRIQRDLVVQPAGMPERTVRVRD